MDRSPHAGPFEVLALVASAGGQNAIGTILRELPAHFQVPIIVMQHLPPEAVNDARYGRTLPFEVERVKTGSALAPGKLLVCAPRTFVELLPDGTCAVSPCESSVQKPMDRLLASVARSFGQRAIAVVLTGMGSDAAAGARQLHLAGGYVLVQSEATADEPSMPKAAVEAGAADLVVPLGDLAQVIRDIVRGVANPRPQSEVEASEALFAGPGEARAALLALDWASTSLGPVSQWPAGLCTTLRWMLSTPFAVALFWGPELLAFVNDAAREAFGAPSLGPSGEEVLPAFWDRMRPGLERVLKTGEPTELRDELYSVPNPAGFEERYWLICQTPVYDDEGKAAGVTCLCAETTEQVLARRRMQVLARLAAVSKGSETPFAVCERAVAVLREATHDVPFALVYLLDRDGRRASLCAACGFEPGSREAPRTIEVHGRDGIWPLEQVIAGRATVLLDDLATRLNGIRCAPWPEPPSTALMVPLEPTAADSARGVVVIGASARRPLDDDYRSWLELVASGIAANIGDAVAREHARERAERLADLDRAKLEFFANISHEFRTPLTLLVAPIEELVRRKDDLPASLSMDVDVAASNSRRLLTLVNNLLDFSQIESRGQHAKLEPTDLGALTTDVVSAFRSAIERGGLELLVQCEPKLPPVPVDPEMWTKIVSNLLSNALKFTFVGQIRVVLRSLSLHAEFSVADTGVGIPEHELPHLFKRFHRVRGARARTAEGAGIGLSIVHDLVTRMGGQLRVRSLENQGTSFTIWMPFQAIRPAGERPLAAAESTPTQVAAALAGEASRWIADTPQGRAEVLDDLLGPPEADARADEKQKGRIVVADDNADMRDYLRRLFAGRWEVETAVDGVAALEVIERVRPDVVLADVMMPRLDGFSLLARIRKDPELSHTPVVLLTARAGESAAIDGLMAGADDYIAKPFSPRELVARLHTVIERARADAVRRQSEERLAIVFQTLPVAVGVVDEKGALTLSNQEMLRFMPTENLPPLDDDRRLRWRAFDAEGRRLRPTEFPGARALRGERVLPGQEILYTKDDGTEIWTRVAAMPMHDSQGRITGAFAVVSDIDALKRNAEALRQTEERQSLLLHLSDRLRSMTRPADMLTSSVEILGRHLGASVTRYLLVGEDGDSYELAASYGDAALARGRGRISEGGGDMAAQLRAGKEVFFDDPPARAHDADALETLGIRSGSAVPILQGGRLVAVLSSGFASPRRWSEFDKTLQREVAERTWTAVERARAEDALRVSEEQLRIATRAAGLGTFDVGVATGAVSFDDNAALAYGFAPRSSQRPHDWTERVLSHLSPEGAKRHQEMMLATMRGEGDSRNEFCVTDPATGSSHWIEAVATLIQDGAERPSRVVGIVRDISERHRREGDLAFLAEVSRDLASLTSAEATMAVLGPKVGAHWGASVCVFGVVEESVRTVTVTAAWHREGVRSVLGMHDFRTDDFLKAYRAGEAYVVEDASNDPRATAVALAAAPLGSFIVVPLVSDGSGHFCLIASDQTPRKWRDDEIELARDLTARVWPQLARVRAEEALWASRERLKNAISLETVGVLFHDDDFRITECNEAFLEMSGFTFEEIGQGKFSWERFTPDDFIESSRRAVEQMRETGVTRPREKQCVRKDGSRFWASFAAKRIGEHEIVEFVTDITLKRAGV